MSVCYMTRTLTGLVPQDDAATAVLRRVKIGETVRVDVVRPRNLKNHKRYWALVNLVYESTDDYPSPDVVHGTLKCLAGHAMPVILKDTGETILVPDSISFSRMDEDEFQDFWQRAVKAVCEKIIPGLTAREVEEEILRCIGASTWTSPEPSPRVSTAGPAVDGRAL